MSRKAKLPETVIDYAADEIAKIEARENSETSIENASQMEPELFPVQISVRKKTNLESAEEIYRADLKLYLKVLKNVGDSLRSFSPELRINHDRSMRAFLRAAHTALLQEFTDTDHDANELPPSAD